MHTPLHEPPAAVPDGATPRWDAPPTVDVQDIQPLFVYRPGYYALVDAEYSSGTGTIVLRREETADDVRWSVSQVLLGDVPSVLAAVAVAEAHNGWDLGTKIWALAVAHLGLDPEQYPRVHDDAR